MTQEMQVPTGHYHYGTGRRKEAVARVRLYPGAGNMLVNGRPYLSIFTRVNDQNRVRLPLETADAMGTYDVYVKIAGGGVSGWAGAIAHGIARALVASNEELRPAMRKAGLLTRDPRVKERKKPGLKRARKAPQYTKR
jgi:small subunit ribosomal protein S9